MDIFHHFQPIYDYKCNKIFGYEALLRCNDSNPEELFSMFINDNKLYELDTLSIHKALEWFCRRNKEEFIFVNVYLSTLFHSSFLCFLEDVMSKIDLKRERIVFEINETRKEEELWNIQHLRTVANSIQDLGFRLAIDDLGNGASSLKKVVELQPDFVKLDKYFSENLFLSTRKQKLIKLLVEYCKGDSQIVLEGIEKKCDYDIANKLGVNFGQGYYIGKPKPI